MTKPKLCIECVHGGGKHRFPAERCGRQIGEQKLNLVTGKMESDGFAPRCEQARRPLTRFGRLFGRIRCGPEGQFYEYVEPEVRPPPPPSKCD